MHKLSHAAFAKRCCDEIPDYSVEKINATSYATTPIEMNGRYVTGQSTDPGAEFVFVQYKGHTLQGSYDGGFVYARKPFLPSAALAKVSRVARVRPDFVTSMVQARRTVVTF